MEKDLCFAQNQADARKKLLVITGSGEGSSAREGGGAVARACSGTHGTGSNRMAKWSLSGPPAWLAGLGNKANTSGLQGTVRLASCEITKGSPILSGGHRTNVWG